jgi:hypothetical protein
VESDQGAVVAPILEVVDRRRPNTSTPCREPFRTSGPTQHREDGVLWRALMCGLPTRLRSRRYAWDPTPSLPHYTSELTRFPHPDSFVRHAEKAVTRAQHAIVGMDTFGPRDDRPANVCVDAVAEAGIYVGLIGLRYGSP